DTGVQRAMVGPADVQIIAAEVHSLDVSVRLHPVDAGAMLTPELLGILNRFPVHALVGFLVYPGLAGKFWADWIGGSVAHNFPSVLIIIALAYCDHTPVAWLGNPGILPEASPFLEAFRAVSVRVSPDSPQPRAAFGCLFFPTLSKLLKIEVTGNWTRVFRVH